MRVEKRDTLSARLETGAKAIALAGAILYATGLLVVAYHIGFYGFNDLDIVKPTYILCGVVFVVYLVGPLLLVSMALYAPHRCAKRRWPLCALAAIAAIAVVWLLLSGFWVNSLGRSFIYKFAAETLHLPKATSTAAFLCAPIFPYARSPVLILTLFVYIPAVLLFAAQRLKVSGWEARQPFVVAIRPVAVIALLFGLIWVGTSYTFRVHAHVRSSWGGGFYGYQTFFLSQDAGLADALAVIAPGQPDSNRIPHARVIHESSNAYYFVGSAKSAQADSAIAFRLTKSIVRLVLVEEAAPWMYEPLGRK
jgi:hypothetical protein